jgi:hypothetical protein
MGRNPGIWCRAQRNLGLQIDTLNTVFVRTVLAMGGNGAGFEGFVRERIVLNGRLGEFAGCRGGEAVKPGGQR